MVGPKTTPKRLRYSTIAPDSIGGLLKFGDAEIEISFYELDVDDRDMRMHGNEVKGFRSIHISKNSTTSSGSELLNWLSVWLGEDAFPVRSYTGDERPTMRGAIEFDAARMQAFLDHVDGWSRAYLNDKWKKACLDAAFGYFCEGIAAGLPMTPATEGVFATSIETLGNVWKFCPIAHRGFGKKHGPQGIFADWPDHSQRVWLNADLSLLIKMRNVCGAHFGLHQAHERRELSRLLREWMERHGCSSEFAATSFTENRLLDELQINAHSLYKTALTLARASFFAVTESWDHFTMAPRDFRC